MSNSSPIKNLCLLAVLTFIVLGSGGLQCALNCLEEIRHNHSRSVRVTDCHLVEVTPEPAATCSNRSCHQGSFDTHALGDPTLSSMYDSPDPLLGGQRLEEPVLRSGEALPLLLTQTIPQPAGHHLDPGFPSQTMLSVRTTVLLN